MQNHVRTFRRLGADDAAHTVDFAATGSTSSAVARRCGSRLGGHIFHQGGAQI